MLLDVSVPRNAHLVIHSWIVCYSETDHYRTVGGNSVNGIGDGFHYGLVG